MHEGVIRSALWQLGKGTKGIRRGPRQIFSSLVNMYCGMPVLSGSPSPRSCIIDGRFILRDR